MHTENSQRIQFLDGLRGIAILLVVLYHTYSSAWKDLTPFFAPSYNFPLVKFGDLGVPLFFIISGFVIVMSLEKCQSLGDFMSKRWLRLFPGMFIATVLVFLTAPYFTARPLGEVKLIDSIAGLTFISPTFFEGLTNHHFSMLEVGFWSLFVEVKFYLLAGWLYFEIGQKKMISALIAMFFAYTGFTLVQSRLPSETALTLSAMFDCLDYAYYGWFAAGALFYRFYISKHWMTFFAAIGIAFISARGWGGLMSSTMLAFIVIIGIFASAMISETMQKILSNKILTFVGFISYPLYLIHENASISTIVQLHQQFPEINVYVLSLLPMTAAVLISWLIAAQLEPNLRKIIKSMVASSNDAVRNSQQSQRRALL